ncbi:hypothetical protein U0070_006334 [Myodes glareolus]|uniref:Uncharacterized protein n=1 Tax=Myodes glareolus TaxID=447135 RepID=A0AAW0GU11_MYOGA
MATRKNEGAVQASLICSCLPGASHINIYTYDDMEVKQINKRASGQAFD